MRHRRMDSTLGGDIVGPIVRFGRTMINAWTAFLSPRFAYISLFSILATFLCLVQIKVDPRFRESIHTPWDSMAEKKRIGNRKTSKRRSKAGSEAI